MNIIKNIELNTAINRQNLSVIQKIFDTYKESFGNSKSLSPSLQNLAVAQLYLTKNPALFVSKIEKKGFSLAECISKCSDNDHSALYTVYNIMLLRMYSKRLNFSFSMNIRQTFLNHIQGVQFNLSSNIRSKICLSYINYLYNHGFYKELNDATNNFITSISLSESDYKSEKLGVLVNSVISFGNNLPSLQVDKFGQRSEIELNIIGKLFTAIYQLSKPCTQNIFHIMKELKNDLDLLESQTSINFSNLEVYHYKKFEEVYINENHRVIFETHQLSSLVNHFKSCLKFIESIIEIKSGQLNIITDKIKTSNPYYASEMNLNALKFLKWNKLSFLNITLQKEIFKLRNFQAITNDNKNIIENEISAINNQKMLPPIIANQTLNLLQIGEIPLTRHLMGVILPYFSSSYIYWYRSGIVHWKDFLQKMRSVSINLNGHNQAISIKVNSEVTINFVGKRRQPLSYLSNNNREPISGSMNTLRHFLWRELGSSVHCFNTCLTILGKDPNTVSLSNHHKIKGKKKESKPNLNQKIQISCLEFLTTIYSFLGNKNAVEKICKKVSKFEYLCSDIKSKFNLHLLRINCIYQTNISSELSLKSIQTNSNSNSDFFIDNSGEVIKNIPCELAKKSFLYLWKASKFYMYSDNPSEKDFEYPISNNPSQDRFVHLMLTSKLNTLITEKVH